MYRTLSFGNQKDSITVKKGLFDELKKNKRVIHLVVIATKPDIIKQMPLILELKKRNEFVLVVHSGQHYDWNLSKGMEQEFNIVPDINLNVKGVLYEQQAQIISGLGYVLARLKRSSIIPYTYGDTTTAVAAGIASYLNKFAVGHVEAGLRTMTPPKKVFLDLLHDFNVMDYYEKMKRNSGWVKGSYEPFPEQFDTRAAAPSAGVHFAPTYLNHKNLLDEGFAGEMIFVVGNPVSDALKFAENNIKNSRIFEKYPLLERGDVIRFCIHRRENVSSLHRFKSIFSSMVSLIKEGRTVLLVSLGATEKALKMFGLKSQVQSMSEKYKNFIYSPVWPTYTDTVAAMKKCCVIATDSGSIQEETNMLGVPGVVLRFNSDRPEAVFAGSNMIAPPIKPDIITKIIKETVENKELNSRIKKSEKLYGENVSMKIVDTIKKITEKESLFKLFEHERMGLDKMDFWEKGEIEW